VVSIGALAIALVTMRLPPPSVPRPSDLTPFLWGAAAVLSVVVMVVLVAGTSPGGLVRGDLLGALSSVKTQYIPLPLHPLTPLWGLAGLSGAVCVCWWLGAGRPLGARGRALVALLRIVVGLIIWLSLTTRIGHLPASLTLGLPVGAPLIWVAAVSPFGSGTQRITFPRALIAALAILQLLQAYPVPGSQLNWSELLLVIVGGICIGDGIAELGELEKRPLFPAWRFAAIACVTAFGVWLCLKPLRTQYSSSLTAYRTAVPVDLPGVRQLRLPPDQVFTLRKLISSLRGRCQTFLTLPGMGSLYLFSNEDPPTEMNVTVWMYYFDAQKQREIIQEAKAFHPLCAVRNPELMQFWGRFSGPVPQRPLVRFIKRDFHVVREFGAYQFMVENGARASHATKPDPRVVVKPVHSSQDQ
jgi:hypothetical protein